MKIVSVGNKDRQGVVGQVVGAIRLGKLTALPTETVYGACVDACNQESVMRLLAYKRRPLGKPFSVFVADTKMAERYVVLNKTARNLYKSFLPGPLTVVSRGRHRVAAGVESETGTLGVRISSSWLITSVVKNIGRPITATSANKSYERRPYKITDFDLKEFGLVVDAGRLPANEPSTVVDTTADDLVVLRQGNASVGTGNSVLSRSEEDTKNISKELWQKYEKSIRKRTVVFALEGQMGTGKTIFAKGLAKAMGVSGEVVSPTFQLEMVYEARHDNTRLKLIHVDAWRMETAGELARLGFEQRVSEGSVVVVEWADRVAEEIREYEEEAVIVWVRIEYGKDKDER